MKGQKVLINNFDGLQGEVYFAVDTNNKRRALIEITKVKGRRAIGRITKGRAQIGYTLMARSGLPSSKNKKASKSVLSLGVMAGYSMDTQSIPKITPVETITMSGSGYSVKGVGDYYFSKNLSARLSAGYEKFYTEGNGYQTTTPTTFHVDISYFMLDALGRYIITPGDFAFWLGGGFGFGIPAQKDSNIIDDSSIATTTLLTVATGMDIKISDTIYIPLQVDYSFFLPATDIKTSTLGLRAGLMMNF